MPTPTKPYTVLKGERKSHRTKAELEQRKNEEAALASGKRFKERQEVKDNENAHKEFKRINGLLKGIEKNDALYEPVINRYCILQSECLDMEEERTYMMKLIKDMKDEMKSLKENIDCEEYAKYVIEFSNSMAKIYGRVSGIDKTILSKRKMLLDIEKENVMTIASALRSIPKKPQDKEDDDPMAKLFGN